jgi:hypothetical protein
MLFEARGAIQHQIKTSFNISNLLTLKILTLNPYALHMFIMKKTCPPWHFVNFSKHMPTYVTTLHVYRRSKAHPGRV